MKETGIEKNQVLLPETPCYPWQVLEADGETWLIVRWKEKVATGPLSEIGGVSLEKFSWDLVYNHEEKCFYCGKIAFQVCYKETEIRQKRFEVQDSWQEEHLASELLRTEKSKEKRILLKRENRVKETAFPALLLDGAELKRSSDSFPAGSKTWEVVLPWRCWVRGKGTNEQPVLKKVHVAQVGFYTLLLEALIKLERKQEFKLTEEQGLNAVVMEEAIFKITEDSVQEIIGLPVERAFWRCSYDVPSESLLPYHLKKIFLIYVSSQRGGERFLIASSVGEESIRIKSCADSLSPVEIAIRNEQVKLGLVSENKVFYQGKTFYGIKMKAEQEQAEVFPERSKPISPEVLLPVKRNRPGERWLKKKDSLSKCIFKSVLTIKI